MKNTNHIIKSRNQLRECVKLIDQELKRCKEEIEYVESKPLHYEHKLNGIKTHYLNQIKGINFCLNEDSNIDNYEWNPYFNEVPKIFIYDV